MLLIKLYTHAHAHNVQRAVAANVLCACANGIHTRYYIRKVAINNLVVVVCSSYSWTARLKKGFIVVHPIATIYREISETPHR